MKKNKILGLSLVIVLISIGIIGCAGNADNKNNDKSSIQKKDESKKAVQFINDKDINISDYDELDKKIVDLDGDGNKEVLLLLGKGEKFSLDEAYLVVTNEKSNEILNVITVSVMASNFMNITDATGDGVSEIILWSSSGGTAGGFPTLYTYNNERYEAASFEDLEFEFELLEGFKCRLSEKYTGKSLTLDLTESQKKDYINFGIYNDNGNKQEYNPMSGKQMEPEFRDLDNDGISEYITIFYRAGSSAADPIASCIAVYKFDNGKFKLAGLTGEAGEKSIPKKLDVKLEITKEIIYGKGDKIKSVEEAKEIVNKELEYLEQERKLTYKKDLGILENEDDYYMFFVESETEIGLVASNYLMSVEKKTGEVYAIWSTGDKVPYSEIKNR